jgi:hypothetical protein
VTNVDVFINCPFDAEYRPAFEALIFAITASGYQVRCALEEDNSADIRHEKLCRLIRESDRSDPRSLSRRTREEQPTPLQHAL